MKKLILAGLVAFLGISLSAQPAPSDKTPEEMAIRMTEKMTENLALTEDQAARVYEMNLDFARKMQEANNTRREIMEAHRANLARVLSDEQMEKLDRQVQKRRGIRRQKGHEKEPVPEEMQPE